MTTYAATVTRTELGLSALSIHDGTTYFIRAFQPGKVPIRREEAKSPLVVATVEIGSVKDDALATMLVQVRGASHSAVQSSISTLISAFSQNEYTLTVSIDGTAYAWTCRKAQYGLDDFDFAFRHRLFAHVDLTFPRSPVSVSGPI